MAFYQAETQEQSPALMRFGRLPTFRETEKVIFSKLMHTQAQLKKEQQDLLDSGQNSLIQALPLGSTDSESQQQLEIGARMQNFSQGLSELLQSKLSKRRASQGLDKETVGSISKPREKASSRRKSMGNDSIESDFATLHQKSQQQPHNLP
mmetsp:Transcript_11587/g.15697  ORF Transcript_11587/g.15697 Transcript_11587/m.15697 type:complete len:151 (-) Transcript_11587:1407-1859(-)